MRKLLTIAVPTYNRVDLLKQNLKYILTQTASYMDDVEIYISNNCSTDGTFEYLEEIHKEYPEIKIVNQETNIGPDGNFISIFKNVESKYLHIISDDDILIDGSFERIYKLLKENDSIDFGFINNVMFYHNFDMSKMSEYRHVFPDCDDIITKDKKEFINYVKLEFTFLSSLIFNVDRLKAITDYSAFFDTNWSQAFIALECARGDSTLAIIGTPCIAQNQLTTSPSFNPFKIFGPNMRDLLDYAGECGFNRKQLEKLHLKRMKTLYRSIGKYKIDKKPVFKDFKPLFKMTKKHISFWFCLYPFLFVPRFIYKFLGKKYYKNK